MQQDATRHLLHTLDLPPGAQATLGEQADSTHTPAGQHAGPAAGTGKRTARPHRHPPLPLRPPGHAHGADGPARWHGPRSWAHGAMCCRNTTLKASTRRSGCRGSSMTGRRGCITYNQHRYTILWWEVISIRIRPGWSEG